MKLQYDQPADYNQKGRMNQETHFFDPEELKELEKDEIDLQAQLEGVEAACLTSESATAVVTYITGHQGEDLFVVGEEDNRWKELIVDIEVPVDGIVDKKDCCSVQ